MTNQRIIVTVLLVILLGCKSGRDELIKKYPTAISPDRKALVYQYSFDEDGKIRVALATWVESFLESGGGGFFDVQFDKMENLKFEWTSDTSVKVIYPEYANVLRKNDQMYFDGRNIHISYEVKLNESKIETQQKRNE